MKKVRTRESRVDVAIDQIETLTGTRIRRQHLFIESRAGRSNSRLKLAMSENANDVSLVRLLDRYWSAHGGLAFAILFSGVLFTIEGVKETWGASLAAFIAVAGGYGLTAWHNRKAERTNPILTFNTQTKLIRGSALSEAISHDDVCFLMAISSVGATENKPETSFNELKLVFLDNGAIRSAILAKGGHSGEHSYDKEILPFVQALRTRLLWVNRPINRESFSVSTATP